VEILDDQKPVSDWATDFDVYDAGYTKNPAPIWEDLQSRCPMAHTERWGGLWMSTKYQDAQDLVKLTSVLSNRQVTIAPMKEGTDLLADYHSWITPPISNDPPEHTPLRRLILPFFTPKAAEEHRAFTEKVCHELIDEFIGKGACDGAVDYAQQLTPRVIGHMLGIDPARGDDYVTWVRNFFEFGFSDIELRKNSMHKLMDFFAEMVAARKAKPGDDYISQLLTKDYGGEPLTDDLVIKLCVLLLSAGIDTTWSSIGSSLLHFATHDDDRRRMVREAELWPSAIEELLRYYAPVGVGRIAMEDLEFNDVSIKRGDRLLINFAAANRDPDAFERADEVVLDRQKNRHIAFGIGVHRCAGSNLARMEMDVALRTWFARIPEFKLGDPEKVTWSSGQVRGARNVPIVF
jgi:cytochrome P450